MTTTSSTDRTSAIANGTAPIPFTFQAAAADEVGVIRNNVPEYGTFTVTLNGDGTGTVTPSADWGGDSVLIFSDPTFEQRFAFSRFAPFYPDQFEAGLDRLARQIIALKGRLDIAGPDASLRTELAGITGSGLVTFQGLGTGAASRQLSAKLGDVVTPEDFGTLQQAITAKWQLTLRPGQSYSIKDNTLGNSQQITGNGNNITIGAGATNGFVLSDYNPAARGLYVVSGAPASAAVFRFAAGRYQRLEDTVVINAGACALNLTPANPAAEVIALPIISNFDAEDVTGVGIQIGSSVSEGRFSNIHLYGKLVAGSGGTRPSNTSVGWQQNTPVVGSNAVGGHQATLINCSLFGQGFHITDGQLSQYDTIIADGCSDYGLLVDGASQYLDFNMVLAGTCRGVKIAGTSSDITIDCLRTIFVGTIPPWGSTDFFYGVTTFYDLEVRNTAKLVVNQWDGPKRVAVDAGAKLIVNSGKTWEGRSVADVAAGSTVYLMEGGAQATESNAFFRVPYDGYLCRLTPAVDIAPGASQSYTYTARIAGVDTALTQAISGASAFGGVDTWAGSTLIPVTAGQAVSIKLVSSAGAAANARHQVQLQMLKR